MANEKMMRYPDFTMASGPCSVSQTVLAAMSLPVVYHYDPVFMDLFQDTCEKLKKVLYTKNDVIIMQGDAVLALESAAYSMIAPGDTVLNLVSGYYGKGYGDHITAFGGNLLELEVPYNESVRIEQVEKVITEHPEIKILSMVHSETPSCTVNPVKEICQLAHKHGILTIVDSVSGVGSTEVLVDKYGIDICIVGSQKCIGAVPGLSIVSVSDAAWKKMEKRNPRRWSVLCMLDWKEMWVADKRFPSTISVSLIYALHQAVDEILEETMEKAWERHELCAKMCRAGLKGMGLTLWAVSEEICATCATSFCLPEKINQLEYRYHLRNKYGFMISAGLNEQASKLLRIGHMGNVAKPMIIPAVLTAVGNAFCDMGHEVDVDAGIVAACSIRR
ncbi:MAG: alanine--glyoxylate aminotransferase family protein [Treponema sp.]|nr:alanine--glyoxylate aminotransferase family protein [Treponema sp.]